MTFAALLFCGHIVNAQKAYYADGYHGGIWGHYPEKYTSFIIAQLKKHPDWKINLEIEPVTWDVAKKNDNAAYQVLQSYLADQSAAARVEIVNPNYGQSYLYNTSGESIIRQFAYGIKKTRTHFPTATFQTYSSEEPCFTSALPQILKSFGFQYASLKNPNTCWGGYTRAFGGELVNWIGPDGTEIVTVPRYEIETLKPGSTWETIANLNRPTYVQAALDYGIKNPLGMTLQDAGWRGGPYLGDGSGAYQPTEYVTYSNYFKNLSVGKPDRDWKFSQEDVQVSLVWGSQVLQQLAQRVRKTENLLVVAEKIAAMSKLTTGAEWRNEVLDSAWHNLLLAQHHDCWIVPYNGKPGDTWADKVKAWTTASDEIANKLIYNAAVEPQLKNINGKQAVRVYNTTARYREEIVLVPIDGGTPGDAFMVTDHKDKPLVSQSLSIAEKNYVAFKASIGPASYRTYFIAAKKQEIKASSGISQLRDGTIQLETDLYRIIVDPKAGGVIKSLRAKRLNKEFVDRHNVRGFNEIRGYFYNDGGFKSSRDNNAMCTVLDNGPLLSRLEISGTIAGHTFKQILTLKNGDPRIDFSLTINWNGNPGIGAYADKNFKAENYKKAFYDDRFKLLALFPVALKNQKVYKDAPFDVTESKLEDTFFSSWDSIKNNVINSWVDVKEEDGDYGFAVLTDHTGNYAHGKNHPLALTLQYSGTGLWGRNYAINGPTQVNYAFIPHKGDWKEAALWSEATRWKEPLIAAVDAQQKAVQYEKSFIDFSRSGLELTAMIFEGNDLLVRVFNAEKNKKSGRITFNFSCDEVDEVTLSGQLEKGTVSHKGNIAKNSVDISIPRFGIKTFRLKNARL
ncbi:MAG: glycosyl hydrolase [Pedobacter sp.]|nr:MAG: glycosyl hydrolase [Pedobacter sp.]